MITVIVVCVAIVAVFFYGGWRIYRTYRRENLNLMNRNEVTYHDYENLPYGADSRVHVKEELSL
jgi:hypothetical protein